METKEILLQENARADSYKLLSECYYPPDDRLIDSLESLDGSAGELYTKIARNIPTKGELESLKIDFSRLFVGPFKLLAPPYGSIYLEDTRRVMGDSTMDVREWYRREGLNVSLREVPDHIAIELEFMYFLIFKEIEAIKNSDSEKASDYLKKQIAFLKTHLGGWASSFADNVENNAQTAFYKDLAHFTKTFIEDDLKNF